MLYEFILVFEVLRFSASGLSNLVYLGFKKSNALTAEGMHNLSSPSNLAKLEFDRCPRIHGGLAYLKG